MRKWSVGRVFSSVELSVAHLERMTTLDLVRDGAKPLYQQVKEKLEQQIKAGMIVAGKYINFGKGVLQGGILSGALANLYLTAFDRKCLSRGISRNQLDIW